jgi:hypothetical protein
MEVSMNHLLLALAITLLANVAHGHDKLLVFIQPDPQNISQDIQDSTEDIIKKFKSKTMELTFDPKEADILVTVVGRYFMPTGDYHITAQTLANYTHVNIQQGVKATVVIMVTIPELQMVEFFKGQHIFNKWGGAARNSWKTAAKWIESL